MALNMFYCGHGLWDSESWLAKTKADQGGIAIMQQKADILPIFIENIYCGAANILKQDMLSIGGEVAVFKYAANCKIEYGNVVIMGTVKHYQQLIKKLANQPWKLKEVSNNLKLLIANVLALSKIKTIELHSDVQADYLAKASIFKPSADLIKDLANFQFVKDYPLILLENEQLDYSLWPQYILALQSKGYKVILKANNQTEKALVNYFNAYYVLY